MSRIINSRLTTIVLIIVALFVGMIISRMTAPPSVIQSNPINSDDNQSTISQQITSTPSETIPPYTPLATLTPSQTLKPPPTFEPPTSTLPPSATPTITPTTAIDLSVSIPGLRGAESPTPTTTPGCTPRKEWKLIYTVQRDDALERIAQKYNTTVNELAAANCLTDPNLIRIDQKLRVPGETHPEVPKYECVPWELLTPINGTLSIPGGGQLTFNWRGPFSPRYLIRIIKPDNTLVEIAIERRQNETIDLAEKIPDAGTYTWYVYPLDENFVQIPCLEGGPWTFTKAQAPTPTPTIDASIGGGNTGGGGPTGP